MTYYSPQTGAAGGEVVTTSSSIADVGAYLRDNWARFVDLYPQILNLQHRAAVAAGAAKQAGDLERQEQLKAVIVSLGKLAQYHGWVVDRMKGLLGYIGLGAIAIPPAYAALFAAVALAVVWSFRRYDYLEGLVDRLESGTVTAAELAQLHEAAPAGDLFAPFAQLAKVAVWGLGIFLGFKLLEQLAASQGGRARRNPDLVVYGANPPGPDGSELIGERVYAISYRHADNSEPYFHDFGDGVEMVGAADGSVVLTHPRRRLWRDFS